MIRSSVMKEFSYMITFVFILQKQPPEVFYEKSIFKSFAKITEKNLCQSLFLIKLQPSACNFMKKEALEQAFSCEFYKIFKNSFFTQHLWATACDSYNFRYNQLKSLPSSICNCSLLQDINIEGNNISQLPVISYFIVCFEIFTCFYALDILLSK